MSRRISRRAFIGGAAGAGALAAGGLTWGALAARDGGGRAATPQYLPTSPPAPSPTPIPPQPRGGRHITVAPLGLSIDTFDAQLTGDSSVLEILGRTHSRLVEWTNFDQPELGGDLATSWEQPDDETFVFRLDPKAKWHDLPPLNGRRLNADDVVQHFRRSLEIAATGKAPLAQRYHSYSKVAGVDSPEPGVVRFRMSRPDGFFLDTLASEFALVQAPEAVRDFAGLWSKADSDHVIGTGPWRFEWADDGVKFVAARGGHRDANLDELWVTEPHSLAGRFIDGPLDETLVRDRRDAALIRSRFQLAEALPSDPDGVRVARTADSVFLERRDERQIVMSTFAVGAAPWNNPALITAISGALNRSVLAQRLFSGRARPAQVAPMEAGEGTMSATRLKFVEGYGSAEGWDAGTKEYRQQWEALGGPGLGTIVVDFPSVFDPLYSASSVVIDMLNEVLGPQFRPAVETYTTISKRVSEGYYGNGRAAFWFGWGPALATPLAARYLQETYDPDSATQRATGGEGTAWAGEDALVRITQQGYFGVVPWLRQFGEVYRKPGVVAPPSAGYWTQHLDWRRASLA